MNYDTKFIDRFYSSFPHLKKEFDNFMIEKLYFDPKKQSDSYKVFGFPDYFTRLWEKHRVLDVEKLIAFLEKLIGQNEELDELIEVSIFEDIMNILRVTDKENKTNNFKLFLQLLGPKSLELCERNDQFWDSIDIEPKSLGNLIRYLREQEQNKENDHNS